MYPGAVPAPSTRAWGVVDLFRADSEKTDIVLPKGNFDLSAHGPLKIPYRNTKQLVYPNASKLLDFTALEPTCEAARRVMQNVASYNTIYTNRLHICIAAALTKVKNVYCYPGNSPKLKSIYEYSMKGKFSTVHFVNQVFGAIEHIQQVSMEGASTSTSALTSALGSTQPVTWLVPTNPKVAGTLAFNPCNGSNSYLASLGRTCKVSPSECMYCAWVKPYDSEYRITDIVQLKFPGALLMSQAVLEKAMYRNTILYALLSRYPRDGDGMLIFPDEEQRINAAARNFNFIQHRLRRMECEISGPETLLVHIRSGDNLFEAYKQNDVAGTLQRLTSYLNMNPMINRVELATTLHFGVTEPGDPFYEKPRHHLFQQQVNADGTKRYAASDKVLSDNAKMFREFYLGAISTGKEVWITSQRDADVDMCRFAKACHFLDATVRRNRDVGKAFAERHNFGELLQDMNHNLKFCR
jgi:hypothetical protein